MPGGDNNEAKPLAPSADRGWRTCRTEVGFSPPEVPSMTDHRNPAIQTGRSALRLPASPLHVSADQSRGSTNLATTPRAGNLSTDTRAGRPG
jgi:hypothetical protein